MQMWLEYFPRGGTGYCGGDRNIYYPDGEFFDPVERETFLHWLANRVLTHTPVEWQDMSMLQWALRPFAHTTVGRFLLRGEQKPGPIMRLLKRHQFTRRFKIQDHGLVGFVTQLIAEVGAPDITCPAGQREVPHAFGTALRVLRASSILGGRDRNESAN